MIAPVVTTIVPHEQIFIFNGDIVYGDCKRDGDCAPLYAAWADLFANGHFSRARAEIPMMGVLDDHDYGQVARRRDDCVIIRRDRISRIPRTTNKTNYLRTTRTRPTHKINDNSDELLMFYHNYLRTTRMRPTHTSTRQRKSSCADSARRPPTRAATAADFTQRRGSGRRDGGCRRGKYARDVSARG